MCLPLMFLAALCLTTKVPPKAITGLKRYNRVMAQLVIHISETEAAKDFTALMAHVRAGAEVIIEEEARAVAVLRSAGPPVRLLSESLRLARRHFSTATLDPDFAKDVEAAIESHPEPLSPPRWD